MVDTVDRALEFAYDQLTYAWWVKSDTLLTMDGPPRSDMATILDLLREATFVLHQSAGPSYAEWHDDPQDMYRFLCRVVEDVLPGDMTIIEYNDHPSTNLDNIYGLLEAARERWLSLLERAELL